MGCRYRVVARPFDIPRLGYDSPTPPRSEKDKGIVSDAAPSLVPARIAVGRDRRTGQAAFARATEQAA